MKIMPNNNPTINLYDSRRKKQITVVMTDIGKHMAHIYISNLLKYGFSFISVKKNMSTHIGSVRNIGKKYMTKARVLVIF